MSCRSFVLTSGDLPPNPAELLGSEKMSQILNELLEHVDVVVIDTPPALVADAQVLSAKVDAVLIVIQPGITQAEDSPSLFGYVQTGRGTRGRGGDEPYSA